MNDAPNRIRELRSQSSPRLSQEALGKQIGVSKVTISDLELGRMALTLDYMRRISEVLGVMPADLLSREDNPAALAADERDLVARLRSASAEDRDRALRVLEVLLPPPNR